MDPGEVERRLREVGAVFIECHEETLVAIRHALEAGMTAETISRLSGLSAPTVRAFLEAAAG